jgi:CPA1 family monovalent cation:H+ antiporter
VLAVLGGIGIGLVVGWFFLKLMQWIRDDLIDIVLSLVTPYAAYLSAERLHCSGVLAVVTAGIYLGAHSPEFLSASTRLAGTAFWNTLVFLLNGVVFMLIGLQLPGIIRGLHRHEWSSLLMDAVWIGGVVILVRILWVFPGAWLPWRFSAKARARNPMPRWNNIAIVAWCGMRGVVSLAAALAVPKFLPNGTEFPERDLVLFFTFAVILITLVGQGLSLPWLIRRLRVDTGHSEYEQERAARRTAAEAALLHIKKAANDHGLADEVCEPVAAVYQERLHHLSDELAETLGWSPTRQRSVEGRRLRREALHAERTHIIALHRQAHLSKDLLHKLERELDLEEARLG